ncbi:hypothetical protein F7725_013583 [Dissostichus mawsoni]|uniref:Uncharacterized protein n=1 Tax=Dissostichus mawsoni TaxID=36200 RepID=A0A7J5Y4B3_DISMA|nr:hypothetical protein F7725_013583 [Dissostichus mawsoni]
MVAMEAPYRPVQAHTATCSLLKRQSSREDRVEPTRLSRIMVPGSKRSPEQRIEPGRLGLMHVGVVLGEGEDEGAVRYLSTYIGKEEEEEQGYESHVMFGHQGLPRCLACFFT